MHRPHFFRLLFGGHAVPPLQPTIARLAPFEFLCPISGKLMSDPVEASDGVVYDRAAISKWMQLYTYQKLSPLRGSLLQSHLEPCPALKLRIAAWLSGAEDDPQLVKAKDSNESDPGHAPGAGQTMFVTMATARGDQRARFRVHPTNTVLSVARAMARQFPDLCCSDFSVVVRGSVVSNATTIAELQALQPPTLVGQEVALTLRSGESRNPIHIQCSSTTGDQAGCVLNFVVPHNATTSTLVIRILQLGRTKSAFQTLVTLPSSGNVTHIA